MMRLVLGIIVTLSIWGPAVPSLMANERTAEERKVDAAIAKALKYLASVQQPSGAWRVDAYGESTAGTSLAVMAFLAAGHLPGEGPYGDAINKGIDWVLDHQEPNGMLINPRHTSHGPMYSHGISTLMVAEIIGMVDVDRGRKAKKVLEDAIRLILNAQGVAKSPGNEGGWRYTPHSRDSDLSVTGWQLLALRAAKDVGCDVPADNIEQAIEYVKRCHHRGGFAYQPRQNPTAVRTGTGILCLEVAGDHHSDEALTGVQYLQNRPLRWNDQHCFYGVYYCSVGMFKIGGDAWKQTQRHINSMLLEHQSFNGSWLCDRENNLGRGYCTSMAILALSIDYRYLPIYQR
ncbi:prenyltransferase/squalene oxidase repeat-containing protein [Thalassoroseus pseudoceratinae]|uniref:prenyltransferase/squalene oxidase repeat-containing protein n=1 Tax=Thalassoroseus pseudoceratinae TaxID=2713176 RepID=UPI0014241A5D|nr:prenyltransferase/squalene oxidase repeat-containing protein [Thalassoroseus pseudoceratinae]